MRVETGYRNVKNPPDDNMLYLSNARQPGISPVTRVIPDCGHTYFLHGHEPPQNMIRSICRSCVLKQTIRDAQAELEEIDRSQQRR